MKLNTRLIHVVWCSYPSLHPSTPYEFTHKGVFDLSNRSCIFFYFFFHSSTFTGVSWRTSFFYFLTIFVVSQSGASVRMVRVRAPTFTRGFNVPRINQWFNLLRRNLICSRFKQFSFCQNWDFIKSHLYVLLFCHMFAILNSQILNSQLFIWA